MTPFDAALSRLRDAAAISTCAVALSPASAALRTRRTAVFSADLTDLLRRRAASLVRMRLIWDLILATPDCLRFVGGIIPDARADPGAHDLRGYQQGWWLPKSAVGSRRQPARGRAGGAWATDDGCDPNLPAGQCRRVRGA